MKHIAKINYLECVKAHKKVNEELRTPAETWIDEYGYTCIKWHTNNGSEVWYHYAIENNEIIWW